MIKKTKRLLNSLRLSSECPPVPDDYEAVSEVSLDSLSSTQPLFIQTANSTYSFAVTDAKHKSGLLMGGEFGESGVAALLLGAQGKEEYRAETFVPKLSKGARAVFLLERDVTRIITSVIRRFIHNKVIENRPIAWL